MKINPSQAAPQSSITVTSNMLEAPKLSIGQRLTATVLQVLDRGVATVAVRDMNFHARTAVPLKPGQVLNLVVTENQPDLVMKLAPGQAGDVLPRALRHAITHQQPHAEFLANLKLLAGRPLAEVIHLPSRVVRLAREAVHNLPDMRQLTSTAGMKSALLNAGVFLERRLWQQLAGGQTDEALRADFKASLLRLRAALSAASYLPPWPSAAPPPSDPRQSRTVQAQPRASATLSFDHGGDEAIRELLRQVEGALARVQLQQLFTLQEQERGHTVWNIELPVKDEDEVGIIQLRVKRDRRGHGQEAGGASMVSFALNLDSLGALYARITVTDRRVSVVLWGERDATVALVSRHLDELRGRLQEVGLKASTLACYRGRPPADGVCDDDMSLLDLRV